MIRKWQGARIEAATLDAEEALLLKIVDGPTLRLEDAGQSCCEKRFIDTNDDPRDLEGQMLRSIEVREVTELDDANAEVHDVAFVVVQGDQSSITLCTHNLHNGYYGGFSLTVSERSS